MEIPSCLQVAFVIAVCTSFAWADVKLPAIISSHMVLAAVGKSPIWGQADPGEEVIVTFAGQTSKAKAGADGKWMVALNLKDSGPGPFEMAVEGKNKLRISDVVVGEVWLASGQSNMEWTLNGTTDAEREIAQSANPLLRQFLVKKNATREPLDNTEGEWVAVSPQTAGGFCAVGYYFAKKLQNQLKVPVGLVHASWGATPSEAWTSVEAIDTVPHLKAARERLWTTINDYQTNRSAFVANLGTWIRENRREDRPVPDAAAYAGLDVSTQGWIPVKIPGPVTAPGLPEAGAVWLRKEVNIPKPGATLHLSLPIDGYESFYWNGQRMAQTTYLDFLGAGHVRRYGPYSIPPGAVKEGRNILALRLYEPTEPAKISWTPHVGSMPLTGEWLAKVEYAFPSLDAKIIAAAPRPPVIASDPQYLPSALFNGMIAPILPYAIHGVIWYQGESNADRAYQYRTAFPLLIADWRKQWNQGDFPFYFCQLANFAAKKSSPGESSWAELREAQSMTLKLPNTGQAVLIDIGESEDIHPRNKKDVGERLALIALARDSGNAIPCSGPVYDSMKVESGKVVLTFKHTHGGLVALPLPATCIVKSESNETAPLVRNRPDSQLEGFAICGEDNKWVWADARIVDKKVIVWSDQVTAPVAVRYAWADNPTCNLANGAGLPASPFRTDNFPPVTLNGKF
jgi:sialate O-acetylesterase